MIGFGEGLGNYLDSVGVIGGQLGACWVVSEGVGEGYKGHSAPETSYPYHSEFFGDEMF